MYVLSSNFVYSLIFLFTKCIFFINLMYIYSGDAVNLDYFEKMYSTSAGSLENYYVLIFWLNFSFRERLLYMYKPPSITPLRIL